MLQYCYKIHNHTWYNKSEKSFLARMLSFFAHGFPFQTWTCFNGLMHICQKPTKPFNDSIVSSRWGRFHVCVCMLKCISEWVILKEYVRLQRRKVSVLAKAYTVMLNVVLLKTRCEMLRMNANCNSVSNIRAPGAPEFYWPAKKLFYLYLYWKTLTQFY